MNELNKKLAAIQKGLKAPKSQVNDFAHFNYRSCEDILEAVKPLLGDLALTLSDEIVSTGDRYYVRATAVLSDGVSSIITNAFAREALEKKGMDEAQITGSASSYARKYALNGLFAIDDTKDADTQDNTKKEEVKKSIEKDGIHTTYKGRVIAKAPVQDDLVITEEMLIKDNVRDTKGHTYCKSCGKVVSARVEKFSMEQYGKSLCIPCQAKEKAKGAK